jgi:hypothetical protein
VVGVVEVGVEEDGVAAALEVTEEDGEERGVDLEVVSGYYDCLAAEFILIFPMLSQLNCYYVKK